MDESLKKEVQNSTHNQGFSTPKSGVGTLMGKNIEDLKKIMGNPVRIDPSQYQFHWWVFKRNENDYVQVGVKDDKVVAVYGIGSKIDVTPFKIGQPIDEFFALNMIESDIAFEFNGSSYKFELSEQEMNNRPLVRVGDFFAQLFIDKFTGELSSVRFVNKETLIKQRPYELVYRGELIEADTPTEYEWNRIEEGTEKQILDITNVIRLRYGLQPLQWDEKVSEVAYEHSKDMAEENYFSHESEKFGTLADRLKAANVLYELAGENIAANYTDAPAVVEGWINSESHREALLNKDFTHLGVGVYHMHYTQNFVKSWE